MIAVNVTIKNDRIVIDDINRIHRKYPGAVSNALGTIVIGVNKIAIDNLSGPGIKKSGIPGGGYPVPVRTGHLRRAEKIVLPGKTKTVGGFKKYRYAGGDVKKKFVSRSYSTGPLTAIAYNAAAYAAQVHKDRPFLTDAVDKYGAARILKALDTEVSKIMK